MSNNNEMVKTFLNAGGVPVNVDFRTVKGLAASAVDPECTLLDLGPGVVLAVQGAPGSIQKMIKMVGLKVPKIEKRKEVTPPEDDGMDMETGLAAGPEDLAPPPGDAPPEPPYPGDERFQP